MPWTIDSPPPPAKNWTDDEKQKCVAAANAALERGDSEQDAIFACIGAAGKGEKAMIDTIDDLLHSEANSDDKQVARPTQIEVNFKALSESEKACESCRYCVGEDFCHLIENHPHDISQKSICDKWELRPGTEFPESVKEPVVEDEKQADEPAQDENEYGYIAPRSNKGGFIQSLKQRLPGLSPGQTMFRDADGRRYMFIVTSNSYEDREHETITSKALQRYVDSCWLADDYFQSNNVHQVWHHDSLTVGDIIWANMAGPFLLEISKERDDIISKVAWDYWESEKGRKDLGASHRFLYRKADKDADGTINLIGKFETTTLPRHAAAANLLTFSGVLPMSKSRDEYLDTMFGVEGVAELLKEGPQKLAEKLAEVGIEHKSTDDTTDTETVQNNEANFGALIIQMAEDLADTRVAFDKLVDDAGQKDTERNTRLDEMETALKSLADENKKLREAMKESPRASQSGSTVVQDDDLQAEIKARTVEYDPQFPGMNVPMEK